jgi:hypothetical protein
MSDIKKMHEKQIENLLNYSEKERYEYFVRYCADWEKVWGLVTEEDSWVIFKDETGDEIFPLWPHPDLAEICCFQEHKDMNVKPQSIDIYSFIEGAIPDMINHKVSFGIFFGQDRKGFIVKGEVLKEVLEEEMEQYE